MLLANGLSTFPNKGSPVFINGPNSLLDNVIPTDDLFVKGWRSFETCALVNSNY